MLLQVFILNPVDRLPRLLSGFMAAGVTGTTVLDCKGGLQVMGQSGDLDDAPPIFGSLRQFLNPGPAEGRLLLTVLDESRLAAYRRVISEVVGDISKPGTGICFSVPITNVEGLVK